MTGERGVSARRRFLKLFLSKNNLAKRSNAAAARDRAMRPPPTMDLAGSVDEDRTILLS